MTDRDLIIAKAKEALDRNLAEEALAIIENQSVENNGDILFLKGEIYFKLQRWGDSLNQFSSYLELFPEEGKAISYCVMIQNILAFYHKDLYNP